MGKITETICFFLLAPSFIGRCCYTWPDGKTTKRTEEVFSSITCKRMKYNDESLDGWSPFANWFPIVRKRWWICASRCVKRDREREKSLPHPRGQKNVGVELGQTSLGLIWSIQWDNRWQSTTMTHLSSFVRFFAVLVCLMSTFQQRAKQQLEFAIETPLIFSASADHLVGANDHLACHERAFRLSVSFPSGEQT